MNNTEELVLGVDIGGSHITVGLVNIRTHEVVKSSHCRVFVNSSGTTENIIETWSCIIEKIFSTFDIKNKRIGIAMPGPFDYEIGVSYMRGNNKYGALYGLNVKQLLAKRLQIPIESILMLNDAASFLKGEVFAGVAINCNKAIGLTLGTGLGTAICKNGLAEDAALWNSPLFEKGIAEDYISTRWFLKSYYEQTGINIGSVKDLNDIASDSQIARFIFKKFAFNLSEFLHGFIKREKPEMIILGGNITKAAKIFLPHLRGFLRKKNIQTAIHISELGELSQLVGAASCWVSLDTRLISNV
jgi:glucokinase